MISEHVLVEGVLKEFPSESVAMLLGAMARWHQDGRVTGGELAGAGALLREVAARPPSDLNHQDWAQVAFASAALTAPSPWGEDPPVIPAVTHQVFEALRGHGRDDFDFLSRLMAFAEDALPAALQELERGRSSKEQWSGVRQLQQALILSGVGASACLEAGLTRAVESGFAEAPVPSGFQVLACHGVYTLDIVLSSTLPPPDASSVPSPKDASPSPAEASPATKRPGGGNGSGGPQMVRGNGSNARDAEIQKSGPKARRVAIECDGPWHFVGGRGRRILPGARTLEKQALLQKDGWTLVSIPYWEWPKRAEAQRRYLRHLFSDCSLNL
ncbi:hypothetical protein T484DRAFT_1915710 [Baffinella frigidus]|nr:hypothetical protein T484DRAFT_1915710 [Cryptophyta sp. CCMP2293]